MFTWIIKRTRTQLGDIGRGTLHEAEMHAANSQNTIATPEELQTLRKVGNLFIYAISTGERDVQKDPRVAMGEAWSSDREIVEIALKAVRFIDRLQEEIASKVGEPIGLRWSWERELSWMTTEEFNRREKASATEGYDDAYKGFYPVFRYDCRQQFSWKRFSTWRQRLKVVAFLRFDVQGHKRGWGEKDDISLLTFRDISFSYRTPSPEIDRIVQECAGSLGVAVKPLV